MTVVEIKVQSHCLQVKSLITRKQLTKKKCEIKNVMQGLC